MTRQFFSVLIAPQDRDRIEAMALPVSMIVAAGTAEAPEFRGEQGEALTLDQVMLRCIGCLPLSDAGAAHLTQRASLLRSALLGEEGGALAAAPRDQFDIAATPESRDKTLEWLIACLARANDESARRSARFMRELGLLRQQHDEIQTSFQNLEQFVYHHGIQKRTLGTMLSPVAGQLPITLENGAQLVQRLPGSSVGLSDVAIHVTGVALRAKGVLNVSLRDIEAKETLAVWEVPAVRLDNGWLRLALDRSLGPDPVSLALDITRQGEGEISVSAALRHPEPRFRPMMNGQTLETVPALQIWRWIAGARAPVSAHAFLDIGGKDRLRRVERDTLATTINLETLNDTLPLFEAPDALVVHVMPQRIACGILPGLALSGMRQISATLLTRHADAPPVEYQLALLPRDRRPNKPGTLPDFDPQYCSGWIRLAPQEEGQAHVIPAKPLETLHDIYLMTRLPEGHDSNAYGWSTFSNLSLQF